MSWLDELTGALEKGNEIYQEHRGRQNVNSDVPDSAPERAQEPVDDHINSGDDNFYNSKNALLLGLAFLLILVLILMRRK